MQSDNLTMDGQVTAERVNSQITAGQVNSQLTAGPLKSEKQMMKSANQTEDTSSVAEIRFRCPCCEKLYKTSVDVFEETQPEFDCQNCQKSFFLTQNLNSFGLFETKANDYTFTSCPKCTHLMPQSAEECPSCGVFVEKYKKMAQAESPTLYELNQLWGQVIQNFQNDESHQKFLNVCQEKMALNLAFQKYDELRKTMSYDTQCEKYLKQIELRLEQQFIAKNTPVVEVVVKSEKINWARWVFASIGFIGLALLIFNKIKPTFPNLSGIIVSITVLSFGLWLIPQKSPKKSLLRSSDLKNSFKH